MSFSIRTMKENAEVANFLADSVAKKLKEGKKVLLFLTGGSSVVIGVKVSELLKNYSLQNLTVALTDERYGEPGHPDSNFKQLYNKGFNLSDAKIIEVLEGKDKEKTAEDYNQNLKNEFSKADYKIGLFGIGADGHTAGILPQSPALLSKELVIYYDTPQFSRITMTPEAIKMLDQVVVFMQGEEKWPILEDLKQEIDIMNMPAQVLKKVPLLTIFTDKKLKE